MPGQEEHPHAPHLKQGEGIRGPAQLSQYFRVADMRYTACLQGFLVDGGRGDGIHLP